MPVDTVGLNKWFAVGFCILYLVLCPSMVTKSHRVLWHFEIYEGFRIACLKCQFPHLYISFSDENYVSSYMTFIRLILNVPVVCFVDAQSMKCVKNIGNRS